MASLPRILLFSVLGALALFESAGAATRSSSAKIVVFGGTGRVGQRIVHETLARGHLLTVVVRDPSAMKPRLPRLRVIKGDVLDSQRGARDIRGADVVICALNFQTLDKAPWRAEVISLISAMRSLGACAPRLIMVGSAGSLRTANGALVMNAVFPAGTRGAMIGQQEALEYLRTVNHVP